MLVSTGHQAGLKSDRTDPAPTAVTRRPVGELIAERWRDFEWKLPRSGWPTDLAYRVLWTSRYLTRRETLFRGAQEALDRRLLRASPVGGEAPTHELPRLRIDELDPETLGQAFDSGVPVVIEGLFRDSEAVRTWNLDFLKERYGDTRIGTLEQHVAADDYDTKHYHVHRMMRRRLGDLVDRVRAGEKVYAIATSALFEAHPEALEAIGLADTERRFGRQIIRPEIFIGGMQNYSPYHCALGANIFCQIRGRKRWTWVAPHHTKWIYPNIGHSKNGLYFASPVVTEKHDKRPEKYPLYSYVPKFTTVLEPGDALVNPSWWWHEVTNLEETVAVAQRVPSLGSNNLLFTVFFMTTRHASAAGLSMLWDKLRGTRRLYTSDDPLDGAT